MDRTEGNFASGTAGAQLTTKHIRVKLDSSAEYVVAGDEAWDGEVHILAQAASDPVTVFRKRAVGTHVFVASEAIAVGEEVSTAAAGKVQGPATAGTVVVGVALTAAAADGDIIAVEPTY